MEEFTNKMDEKLFFGVFRSIVIRNNIFRVMKLMKCEFKSPNDYHIKNRISFDKIRSLEWYIKRNKFTLLKDRLLHWDSDYLLVKDKHLNRLIYFFRDHSNDIELISLVYEKLKSQLVGIDFTFQAASKNNFNAVKLFIEKYSKTISTESLIQSLHSNNLEMVKYLFDKYSGTIDPLKFKHIYNLNPEIYQYLIEIDIYKNASPIFDFSSFFSYHDIQFSKYIFDRGLVNLDLKDIENFTGGHNIVINDAKLPKLKLLLNKININYQNILDIDQHHLISKSIGKQFKINEYPSISKIALSILTWCDFENIDSMIQQYKSTFKITELKDQLFKYYSIYHNPGHSYLYGRDGDNIQCQFTHLKLMIKYQYYNSKTNNDGTIINLFECDNEEPIFKWWLMKYTIRFNEFTFNQVMELIELIKSNSNNNIHLMLLDKLFTLLYCNDQRSSFPDYFNSFSNSIKLYNSFNIGQLPIKSLYHIISNLELKSLINLSNNDKRLSILILGKHYNQDNHQILQPLINQIISYCNNEDITHRIITMLKLLGESTITKLPFIQFITKQLNYEIKELMVIQDLYFLSPEILEWILNNFGNLINPSLYLSKLIGSTPLMNIQIDNDYIECIIVVYNFIKSNNLSIEPQPYYNLNLQVYIRQTIIKENSIKWYRFCIQSYKDLVFIDQSGLFSNSITMEISDSEILNLINQLNSSVRQKARPIKRIRTNDPTIININEEIEYSIKNNQLYRLVLIGEFKLAIELYSKLKSTQPKYKLSYDNDEDEDEEEEEEYDEEMDDENQLKTFITIKNFKSIIKYQELDIIIGLFEMTSRYYCPYACNQLVKISILLGRIDVYNYFKSLHQINYQYINHKFKRGIITIGFLNKLIHSNYFCSFLKRGDLPMFKFLLDQYLNHHQTITQHTDQHLHNLIYKLSNRSIEYRSIEISNYLSNTYPQFVNSQPIHIENENEKIDDENDEDSDYENSEFYDFNINNKYFKFDCGHSEYHLNSPHYNNMNDKYQYQSKDKYY